MANSNQVRWSYVVQPTLGTAPGGTYQELRRTGGDLTRPQNTVVSSEVRSDRQRSDVTRVGVNALGNLTAELAYGAHDALLEGAFGNSFSSPATTTASLTTVKSTSTITMTGAFTSLVAGQWFEITGSAANDGFYKIATRTDNDNVVVEDNTQMGADATAEGGVTIKNDGMLRNGTTFKAFSFEKEYLDLTNQIWRYDYCTVNGFSLRVPNSGLVEISFDLMGANGSLTGSLDRSALTAANTNSVMNGTSHIFDIREGSSALGDQVTELTIGIGNNARERRALGSLSPVDIRHGTGDYNGEIQIYYADGTLLTKYMDQTESSLSFRQTDGAGNTYIWTIPRFKYQGGSPEDGGLDADVMIPMPFTAFREATLDCSIQLDKFDA